MRTAEAYQCSPQSGRVATVLRFFQNAVVWPDEDLPLAISEGAASLAASGRSQLSVQDRAEVRYAIFTAADEACARFPADFSRAAIRLGFRAFADQVDHWSETPEQRRLWGDRHLDVEAAARIFRNECHNLVLKTEIEARAHIRNDTILRVVRDIAVDVTSTF
jgi:hypothetical protein